MKNVCWRKLFVVLGVSLCMGLGTMLVQGAEGAATSASTSSLASGAVKWHPGHYVAVDKKQNDKSAYLKGLYADLDATPALRGVLLRFTWSELEPTRGNYDFSAIEKHLSELAAHHKQLILFVETKSFGYPNEVPIVLCAQ